MIAVTRGQIKAHLHQSYRQSRSKFYTGSQLRRARTRDGGSPPSRPGYYYSYPPNVYDDGLLPDPNRSRYTVDERRRLRHGVGV